MQGSGEQDSDGDYLKGLESMKNCWCFSIIWLWAMDNVTK